MVASIHLLGTSHIASQSIRSVKRAIKKVEPTIVAVELDRERLYALEHPEQQGSVSVKDIRHVGMKGWLFAALGSFVERRLGSRVGVKPGADMLAAVTHAKKEKLRIALIDQPIKKTLSRLSQEITWREKGRFIADIVTGPFKKQELPFDLNTVPSNAVVTELLEKMAPRYPSLYRVLLVERNKYMAARLKRLAVAFPEGKILAIVGAGHVQGIHELLTKK